MTKLFISNRNKLIKYLSNLSIILVIFVFSACGGDYSSSYNDIDTGSYAFSIRWPADVPTLESSNSVSRAIDCVAAGVETVVFTFYDGGGRYLTYAEFFCTAHSGTVNGILAGTNRRLVVTGEDSNGNVLYQGELTGITILADQTTQGEEIYVAQLKRSFVPIQAIPTSDAQDWEFFTIDGESFLAAANGRNDTTRNIDSKIYIWNGTSFAEVQAIPTNGAIDWESFTINGETFIAVANYKDDITYEINSNIYKWNGSSFVEEQAILTYGARDWESFTIDGEHYLAVAQERDDSANLNILSKIYKWNGSFFVEEQTISTSGARDWESFTISGETFIAVANYSNGPTVDISSKIYKWNGSSFIEEQTISTSGAHDWEYFTIDGEPYLAVANCKNDSTRNIDSKIYKWNGTSFVEVQTIPTTGVHDWEYFTIDGEPYLAVANERDDAANYNISSKIYKWNGTSFVEVQAISTNGAQNWESFTLSGETFIAVANARNDTTYNIDSKIYKWSQFNNACTNSLGITLTLIPAGTFTMGSPTDESGRDSDEIQHQVTLTQPFYMQTTEVTQAQWETVMGSNPSYFNTCGDDCPVEQVSWNNVQTFITSLNALGEGTYRLPTEAEWEYAARADSTTAFANGEITYYSDMDACNYDSKLVEMGWYCYNSSDTTHPVAQKNPNAWGLYDMHGNVWEWCNDWYDESYYTPDPVTDPSGPLSGNGNGKVGRGGSWSNSFARYCRSANRGLGLFYTSTDDWNNDVGFRLVRNP